MSAGVVKAQESFSLAGGIEADGYSVNNFIGAGPLITLDYRFNEMWAVGARGLLAVDLVAPSMSISTVQLDLTGRWYFLRWKEWVDYYFIWQNTYHFFAQLDVGGSIMSWSEKPGLAGTGFSVGGTSGCRIMLSDLFVEPYIRFGVTSQFGAGVLVGYTFRSGRGGF
jgi:hypothetical protein